MRPARLGVNQAQINTIQPDHAEYENVTGTHPPN